MQVKRFGVSVITKYLEKRNYSQNRVIIEQTWEKSKNTQE